MNKSKRESKDFGELSQSFLGVLTIDIILAQRRRAASDSQSARRDLIRTTFAAIEGYVWDLREQVYATAKSLDDLPMLLELALLERSYTVSEAGKVRAQTRFLSLAVLIRLVTNLAARIHPGLAVDFSGPGWASFREAVRIRHRVTHPKRIADLQISDTDIQSADQSLHWLLETTVYVKRCMLNREVAHLAAVSSLLEKLQNRDPDAIAAYEKQLLQSDD